MLERLVYVGWLVITAASLSALILSLTFAVSGGGGGLFLSGAGGIVISYALNRIGRAHLNFDRCERSLEVVSSYGMLPVQPGYEERASSLRRILEEWTLVEEQILAGKTDIWQRQALRRRAQSLLAADPNLRQEFEEELSAHPELNG
ncbi:MAG TPA: hypothetical protein VFG14_08290 [Chthoniobacteraceae bacterium]|nr:hypothetical protein [Chthoniobacteraceae bacterium]